MRIVRDHGAAKSRRDAGDHAADLAEADDAERAAMEQRADQAVDVEVGVAGARDGARDVA